MRARLRGGPAWIALIAAVTAYELCADTDELLTAACERAMTAHPVLTRAAILVTATHLLGLLPAQIDPFTQAARAASLARRHACCAP